MVKTLNDMQVIQNTLIAQDTVEMILKNQYISEYAKPGQFLYIKIGNHTLRRPISIADVDKEKETITILFKIIGTGTKQLASILADETIHVLGPNGNGFTMNVNKGDNILIVGGGIGVPPLYYLAKQILKQGAHLTFVLGFQSKMFVFYEEQFNELGETHIVTNDGSYGRAGFVTDVIRHFEGFDAYYACGPLPMLQAVKAQCVGVPGFLSLEEHMGCGIGACLACVIETADGGYRKICKDGPVFPAEEVTL